MRTAAVSGGLGTSGLGIAMATNYRGPLVVDEQKEAQSNGDSCCDVVGNGIDKDDVKGGAPDPDCQEEQVAKKMEVDVSVPVVCVGCVVGL